MNIPKKNIKQNMLTDTNKYDVAIIGGGAIGLISALMLCQQGLKTVLLEKGNYENILDNQYDGRTFAYAYGAKLILQQAGIWDNLKAYVEVINDIFVKADGQTSGIHYQSTNLPQGLPMGYNIENRFLFSEIYKKLATYKNFTVIENAQITNFTVDLPQITINLGNHNSLCASLLLAADGKNSFVRKYFGIQNKKFSYAQQALICVIEHEIPHKNCAYEYFLKSGPLAALPMSNQCSNIIWSSQDNIAKQLYNLDDLALSKEIYKHLGAVLGKITVKPIRYLIPLEMMVVKNYVAPRLVLIGDSAHAIHPVAGQGFNLGLRDIACLTDTIAESIDLGLDIGSLVQLKQYEKKRRFDVISITGMCDSLVRIFSSKYNILRKIGSMGFHIVNASSTIKLILQQHAMGIKQG